MLVQLGATPAERIPWEIAFQVSCSAVLSMSDSLDYPQLNRSPSFGPPFCHCFKHCSNMGRNEVGVAISILASHLTHHPGVLQYPT